MVICACGCGESIEEKPHHKYKPVRYLPDHFLRAGLGRRGRFSNPRRIPPDTLCGCGCGTAIPPFYPSGAPRYAQSKSGAFYVRGHQPYPRGADTHTWKGGRSLSTAGYVILKMPGHHLADKRGNVREHRLVWEKANGRRLLPTEAVHHINGIKSDNRPENLVAMTNAEHIAHHGPLNLANSWADSEAQAARGKKGAEKRWH